jgi:hypothetical protein
MHVLLLSIVQTLDLKPQVDRYWGHGHNIVVDYCHLRSLFFVITRVVLSLLWVSISGGEKS